MNLWIKKVVALTGIEPVRPLQTHDFKSCASTSSATGPRERLYHDKNHFFTIFSRLFL